MFEKRTGVILRAEIQAQKYQHQSCSEVQKEGQINRHFIILYYTFHVTELTSNSNAHSGRINCCFQQAPHHSLKCHPNTVLEAIAVAYFLVAVNLVPYWLPSDLVAPCWNVAKTFLMVHSDAVSTNICEKNTWIVHARRQFFAKTQKFGG